MTAKNDGTRGLLDELIGNASLWEALLEEAPVGMFLVDGQYAVQHANPLLAKWLGKKKDLLGKKCHEVLFGSKEPCKDGGQVCPTAAALESGKVTGPATFRRQAPGGMQQYLRVDSRPILYDAGSPRYALEFVQDVTSEVLLRDYREEAALRDPLTGLYNRQGFNQSLGRELKRTTRQGHPLSLCLVDLDSFKDYNEKKGEQAGDAVLERLAGILVAQTRVEVDSLARLQADTFALILPEASREQALRIGGRIRSAAEEAGMPISFSMAICQFADSEDSDGFYRRAADLLFQAKKSGGNQTV
jgi:diguanylate cyclase (GGDEF)-like protein/PAS domain S-box-containing protein